MAYSDIFKPLIPLLAFSLAGCSSILPKIDLMAPTEVKTNQTMSVERLLAQARGETVQESEILPKKLMIMFTPGEIALSDSHQARLHRFANHGMTNLKVECSLSHNPEQFVAISQGIQRCNNVSSFLEARARKTEIRLTPELQQGQVKISQAL